MLTAAAWGSSLLLSGRPPGWVGVGQGCARGWGTSFLMAAPAPGVPAHPRTASAVPMMIIGLSAHLFHLVAAT